MRSKIFNRTAGAFAALAVLVGAPAKAGDPAADGAVQSMVQPAGHIRIAQSDPFLALVGKRRERSERDKARRSDVERYIIATDNRIFLFENLGQQARLKFLCREGGEELRLDCLIDAAAPAEEIHVLTPTRGSRGDTIYKDAQGETMLRMASYGGATVFWPGDLRGHAASKSFGDDAPLQLPRADSEVAVRRAQAATARLSAQTGAPIVFDIGEPGLDPEKDAGVLADAVVRTAKGMARVADDPTGARILATRLKGVRFTAGPAPGLSLNEGFLIVTYNPAADLNGRTPTSEVARFLEESL